MISIFVMYSQDRRVALEATVSCLQDMPLYDQCQKILVVDGTPDYCPDGWLIVGVPRNGDFCWASMWNAGVANAIYPNVIYLDSDRLLPKCFLIQVAAHIQDDVFLFTSHHFMMLKSLPIIACKEFLENFPHLLSRPPFLGKLQFEPRHQTLVHGPGKNVMSGCTAFTKATYQRLGGVDPWYRGHGAYADTDFHYTAERGGCRFIDLELPELHWPHFKRDVNGKPLSTSTLDRLALDNYIYYCKKWKLPMDWAKRVARGCRMKRAEAYIEKQWLRDTPGDTSK